MPQKKEKSARKYETGERCFFVCLCNYRMHPSLLRPPDNCGGWATVFGWTSVISEVTSPDGWSTLEMHVSKASLPQELPFFK
jgi:hypothetical protein